MFVELGYLRLVDALRFRFIRVRQRQFTNHENKPGRFQSRMNTNDTDLSI
jgi:hypothetical protein